MNRSLKWGFALMLLPIAACSHNENMAAETTAPQPVMQVSAQDQNFATQAAQSGLSEVQEGQLAAQKAGSPRVRQFAERMVRDHSQANQQLMDIAQRKGITLPAQPSEDAVSGVTSLRNLRGRGFDRQYAQSEVMDHKKAIALFQQEADQGTDADLKAFAQQTLPVLQQHLQMAQSLAGGRRH